MKKLRRAWLLFLWGCGRWIGNQISESEFFCQNGEHDWSETEIDKNSHRFMPPIKIPLPNGDPYEVVHVYRKGTQTCRREQCRETQKVFQIAFISPVPKSVLDQLPLREAKKFQQHKTPWMKVYSEGKEK